LLNSVPSRFIVVDDPERGVQQAPAGPQVVGDLHVIPLTASTSHHVPRAHEAFNPINGTEVYQPLDANGATAQRGSRASDHHTTSRTLVSNEATTCDAVRSFTKATAYTTSIADSPTTHIDQHSITAFSSTPQYHSNLAQSDAALSTIGLDNCWLSSQGPYTGQTLMCPYHDPIFQGNVAYATQGLGPMARYFAAPASEQYAIFSRSDTRELSTTKGCRCLEMLQLNIDTEEDTQER
jgi:hypothetical protein